jgi:hypothetical protein
MEYVYLITGEPTFGKDDPSNPVQGQVQIRSLVGIATQEMAVETIIFKDWKEIIKANNLGPLSNPIDKKEAEGLVPLKYSMNGYQWTVTTILVDGLLNYTL